MSHMKRRHFLGCAALGGGALALGGCASGSVAGKSGGKRITIAETGCEFEREPLLRPFGFKGGYLTGLWQSAAMLRATSGKYGVGLCTQSTLWSDESVFTSHSEDSGNALMFAMTGHALQQLKGASFSDPVALNDALYEEVYKYGQKITGLPKLRRTFALNALVGVDCATWLLYARENNITEFDTMVPERYRTTLAQRHSKAASIPLMTYGVPVPEIRQAADDGYFFMKIKIGQPGTQEEMLRKDTERLSAIHNALKDCRTPHTRDGRLPYYLDANGRYEKKETLLRFLEHARRIGAFDQIAIIEEPFDEEAEMEVHDIPVRLAADESAHTDQDTIERIEMGYKAVALKVIAKTLSMTLKIAKAAHERNVPCFCADLTVSPVLVEWNKLVAARLAAFPGIGSVGLLETNGHQNYKNWETMRGYHPRPDAVWANTRKGLFTLDDDYYASSGGIFAPLPHYESLFPQLKTN